MPLPSPTPLLSMVISLPTTVFLIAFLKAGMVFLVGRGSFSVMEKSETAVILNVQNKLTLLFSKNRLLISEFNFI